MKPAIHYPFSRRLAAMVIWCLLAIALLGIVPSPTGAHVAFADEGWVINSFDAAITIAPDGSLQIVETILVDFGSQQKHGIFRDIPVVYDYDESSNRVYDLSVRSVADTQGRPIQYEVSREGSLVRIQIGDPDVTVSGPQSYRITYQVQGALNSFPDHDELYWNVNGIWPVRTLSTTAEVTLPGPGLQQVTCFQGAAGSQQPCRSSSTASSAGFATAGTLTENQQLTIVVGFDKGLVPEPQPRLEAKPRTFVQFFEVTPLNSGIALALSGVVLGLLGWSWWTFGRDRRYTTIYYLTDNPAEETRPLLSSDPIVVEYTPPEGLHPAQMGLLLDESADTLDVTATIVDLAVRGYLHITEVPKSGLLGSLFGGKDWELARTDRAAGDLLPYEQIVLRGLFASGSPVRLSALKNKFYSYLKDARDSLYQDGISRRWFVYRPDHARALWAALGTVVTFVGAGAVFLLGLLFGAGLVGIPIALAGLLLLGMSYWMSQRTARGRELMRRTLGFRQYVATAETSRQQFNERINLFAEYLPYAIVFRCVDKWARAFQGLDTAPATQSWYTGTTPLSSVIFAQSLHGFSSAVSSAVVSTPGGSGGSGFSGGSAGGGGGGGGGGSW